MKIKEICACGSSFLAEGADAVTIYNKWVKRHQCPEVNSPVEPREVEMSSTIGFSADYSGTGLDLPAKDYDPYDE
jgi:hypothetical protein